MKYLDGQDNAKVTVAAEVLPTPWEAANLQGMVLSCTESPLNRGTTKHLDRGHRHQYLGKLPCRFQDGVKVKSLFEKTGNQNRDASKPAQEE